MSDEGVQLADADLAVQTLIGARDIAAAKPYANTIGQHFNAGITHDCSIPRLIARDSERRLLGPRDSVPRSRQADATPLIARAAGVEHPVRSAGAPYRGLAESVFIEGARRA